MKKMISKNRLSLPIVLVIVLAFVVFQYSEYRNLPKVAAYTTVPVDGADNLPINWRFFAIPYENLQSENDIQVAVSPHYDNQIALTSQKEIYLRSIEGERAQLEQDAQGRFDEFVDSYYPSDKRVTVERIGEPYAPNTTYTIIVTNKPFNIFYYILGTKTKQFTFITGTDTVDEFESRKSKFKSSLGTFLATVPSKEELEHQKKAQHACQLDVLITKLQRSINGNYYELETLDCDTVNFTGETVTVKLLDPRGKSEFEKFLKDNSVNLKLLKITYVSK